MKLSGLIIPSQCSQFILPEYRGYKMGTLARNRVHVYYWSVGGYFWVSTKNETMCNVKQKPEIIYLSQWIKFSLMSEN